MLEALLIITLLTPAAAAVVAAALGSRPSGRALDAATVGVATSWLGAAGCTLALVLATPVEVGPAGSPLLRFDSVAALLSLVVLTVAVTVLSYARRQLADDDRASEFAAAACVLVAATLLMAAGARLSIVVASWVITSAATLALCRYRRDRSSREAADRAAAALVVGDLGLVGALALTWAATGGDVGLGQMPDASTTLAGTEVVSGAWGTLGAGSVVAALLVLAALARAGQVPFRPWLTSTVAAPTPVSALLHAGSVNAGGFLLVRTLPVLADSPVVAVALALCCGATILWAAAAVRARADVKGRLATSTAAQMSFMLLACAVGAPAAALTHLGGHALYKSARFLGAGGAVTAAVTARREGPPASGPRPATAAAAAVALGGAGGLIWWLVGGALDLAAPERWVVGAVIVALLARTGAAAAPLTGPRRGAALWTGGGAAITVGLAAVGAHGLLDVDHPTAGSLLAPTVLLAVAASVVAFEVILRTRPGGAVAVVRAGARASAPARRLSLARSAGFRPRQSEATVQEAW